MDCSIKDYCKDDELKDCLEFRQNAIPMISDEILEFLRRPVADHSLRASLLKQAKANTDDLACAKRTSKIFGAQIRNAFVQSFNPAPLVAVTDAPDLFDAHAVMFSKLLICIAGFAHCTHPAHIIWCQHCSGIIFTALELASGWCSQ